MVSPFFSFLQYVFAQSQLWPQLFNCVQRTPPLAACSPRHWGRRGGKEPVFPPGWPPFPSKTLSARPCPKASCVWGAAFHCPSAKEKMYNTSTQRLIYPSPLPDYRWAGVFFIITIFLDDDSSFCVCVGVGVCVWQSVCFVRMTVQRPLASLQAVIFP